jgi:hypothetical protein
MAANLAQSNIAVKVGEPAPWFLAAKDGSEMVAFDELGGRYLVLFFFGHAVPPVVEALAEIERCPLFDGDHALCVAVGNRREDFSEGALPKSRPGHLYLLDGQGDVTRGRRRSSFLRIWPQDLSRSDW